MSQSVRARVFFSGRSQHVTIPREFRFRTSVVSVRRDPNSGAVILSEVPSVDEVFAALDAANIPEDFLLGEDRDCTPPPDLRPELDDLFEEKQ